MQLRFDDSIKLAGIGIVPWTRLGPEQWLPQYKIASLYGWDVAADAGLPPNIALSDHDQAAASAVAKLNTATLLNEPAFQRLLAEKLPDYAFLTYKTLRIPPALQHRKFLMVDTSFSEVFENKVEFRKLFDKQLSFPDYAIYDRTKVKASLEDYEKLRRGRKVFVLQDEQLSGGKGTFIIGDYQGYTAALPALAELSKHARVVVSDAVRQPRERSIQACVTRYGVVTGPLQRQIVRHPLLANMAVPTGDKWCGAQVYQSDQNSAVHKKAETAARSVGEVLAARGYRGIFGVDFLLDADDKLFTIEVNPRITGVTPLLAALFRGDEGVPFYLLHLLELGGYDYDITDKTAEFNQDGSLLVVHSLENQAVTIRSMPASGTYRITGGGTLERVSGNLRLHRLQDGEWIIQEYLPPQMVVKPGGRLLTLQTRGGVINKTDDSLYNEAIIAVKTIYNAVQMEKHL